jgi:hypothetical protein
MRFGANIDQSGEGLNRLAFVDTGQKPDGALVTDDARWLSLADNVFRNHVDEELFPLGRIIHLGADDGEQLIRGFARDFAIGEHFPLKPDDILRRYSAAEDHRADDRPAPVDRESHHTHLHPLRSADFADESGYGATVRANVFPGVNPSVT